MSEPRPVDWNTTFRQLDVLEQDKLTFHRPDPLLQRIVDAQSDRLGNAAAQLGHKWNGSFSRAHVLLIAKAYLLAKDGQRQMEREP